VRSRIARWVHESEAGQWVGQAGTALPPYSCGQFFQDTVRMSSYTGARAYDFSRVPRRPESGLRASSFNEERTTALLSGT
jgi:hypothetical protein